MKGGALVIRIECQDPYVGAHCIIEPATEPQCVGEVVMQIGMVRQDSHRVLELADRLVQPSQFLQRDAKVVVSIRVQRINSYRLTKLIEGGIGPAHGEELSAEPVVRVRVSRVQLDRSGEMAGRLAELA